MIRFDQVSVRYSAGEQGAYTEPILHGIDLQIEEGELVLLIGRTGSGKSTLLRTVNGLVPHFTGGLLTGEVTVAGRSTRQWRPRDLADRVGLVAQEPMASFVTDTVEDELAYTMEALGVAPEVMRVRVEETLDLLGLAEHRQRALATLSGGQQQRVAIGAALTAHPQVLVLDEPTSALDPQAAEEVLAAIQRLVHDLGMTVLMAEHRLERVIQYADRVVELEAGRILADGPPAEVMKTAAVAPPVVRLGRRLGWDPLPVGVRDARRRAAGLRSELGGFDSLRSLNQRGKGGPLNQRGKGGSLNQGEGEATLDQCGGEGLGEARRLVVRRPGPILALNGVDLRVRAGEVVALMGRNGSGKSTLLGAFTGALRRTSGEVSVGGADSQRLRPTELVRRVGLVPQDPSDLLYAGSVAEECHSADRDFGVPAGTCATRLDELAPGIPAGRHPRDLSEGQRMCLALAVVLTGAPPLLLLDEPTRGLDYGAKRRLADRLAELAAAGHGVVLSTHDVELAAELADRVVVLAEGELVADGPTSTVVTGSPMFAPQVAKVFAPLPLLTVGQLESVLR